MSTLHHTDIPVTQTTITRASINDPLGQLDQAIEDESVARANGITTEGTIRATADANLINSIDDLENEVGIARNGLASIDARFNADEVILTAHGFEIANARDGEASLQARLNRDSADSIADVNDEAAARTAVDAILQTNLDIEASARGAAITGEASSRIAGDLTEATTRTAAIAAEAAIRLANDNTILAAINTESTARAAAQSQFNDRVSYAEAAASVNGGAATTRLTHAALAAEIIDIGSDGTLLTILTIGDHGMADGDYVGVTGTTAYDGTMYGPINVIAADEITMETAIPATAHETTGWVSTNALRVQDNSEFLTNQWVELVRDDGAIHVSKVTVGGDNYLNLTTPIPATWVNPLIASVDSQVSITPREIMLARIAAPGSEITPKTLGETIRALAKGVPVEFFGADPTGGTPCAAAFNSACNYVGDLGGGVVLGGGAGARYWLEDHVQITKSNVTLDGNHALVIGTSLGRFYINGDTGIDGDWSGAVYNSHIMNWRVGDSILDNAQIARGPRISWGIDCTMRDIVKTSRGGTGFVIDMSKRCKAFDIVCRGAQAGGGAFGFLVHMSDDTLVERLAIADGPFYYGVQTKGGNNNVIKDAVIRNVVAAGAARTVIGFRDRGNSPYKSAGSASIDLTYPYADIGWLAADPRRLSKDTRYINCQVFDSTIVPFVAQEVWDTQFIDCFAKNCLGGITLKRTEGSIDARLTVAVASGATVLTIAMEVDDETGLPEDPWLAGQSVVVETDIGLIHTTTAAVNQVGNTLTLSVGLPAAAGVNKGVGRTQTGNERGYLVQNFRESGGTANNGINITGATNSYLPGVVIKDAEVSSNFQNGLTAGYTDKLMLMRVKAYNNNTGLGTSRGINIQLSTSPRIYDCEAYDDQAVHTQQQGIVVDPTNCFNPAMRNCSGFGNTTRDLQCWLPGYYSGNAPGEGFATTTDATANNSIWRCQLSEGDVVEIDVLIMARRTNGADQARYQIKGTYRMTAGVVTALVGPASTITDYETQAAYAASLQISGALVRANVLGMAGHNINWTVQARTLKAA
jgi:hypothetical protein